MAQQPVKPPTRQRDEQRENEREAERDQRENEREAERQAKFKAKAAPVEAVQTIADEQRERSAEIEDMGVEAWKAAGDERPASEKQKTVAGVHTAGDARTLEPGSARR
jgi:hypothetical protein